MTMKKQYKVASIFVILVGMLWTLGGCGSGGEKASTEKVTLAMGYIPNVQFTPYYVAVENGYFADEGIEIGFDYGWETDLLKLVGSDELQFAIASGDQVILARSQELPVVYVLNWYRRFPVCVMSLAETGIREPQDLVGKRVGTPVTYGASYIGWRALLDAVRLNETDMELISIGYTQVAALSEGQVDAAICYAMNEPVQMQSAGYDLDIIYVADYANLPSNGLITNEKTIRERPELVQGMVRAALRGLAFTLENPDAAFDIALKYVPEAGSDAQAKAVNRAILDKSVEFWRAAPGELGRTDETEWQAALRIMQRMGLVATGTEQTNEMLVSSMFTNQFVEEAKP